AQAARPEDRYAEVDSFVRAFDEAFGERLPASLTGPISNPYRGLQAFTESDAGHFFGRERLVERLLARVGESGARGRFVVVVGPSGSGKSSVVRAGLVPALRRGAAPGSERWFVVKMTPGRRPFDALQEALLTIAVEPPHDLRGRLEAGISEVVRAVTADPDTPVVLVIDQLEELFTHAPPADAAAFLDALSAAARHPHRTLKVIATLRADFYDHPLRHRDFGELLRLGTEVIVPMNAEELTRAVELPASSVGVRFEQGLVSEIVAEMAGQPTALPLLQHALTELFDQRTDDLITFAAHRHGGGVSAALGRRADEIYLEMDEDQRTRARDVFLRLVTLGEDSSDTRRRVLVSELADAVGGEPTAVLDAFGRNRLLTFDRDPVARTPTVEIAHEALLTEWGRLRHWIADARLDVQAQRRLAVAATEWAERGEDPDFLLAGGRLQRYDGWTVDPPVRLTSGERRYLVAAEDAARAGDAAERRRVRRLRRLVAGVSVALVIAVIAGAIALVQRRSANAAADRAELANLVSRSAAVGDDDPELALLLALEAYRRSASPETEQAVLAALGDASIATRIASLDPLPDECVGFSTIHPVYDGMLEFATVGGRMLQHDPLIGEVTDLGPPPGPCAVGASLNGITAAVAPDLMRGWFGSGFGLEMDFDRPTRPEWITEDRVVLRSGLFEDELDEVTIHDIATGEQLAEPIVGEIWMDLTYDPAARLFAVSFVNRGWPEGEGQLFVVDAVTGEQTANLVTPRPATSLAFDEASGHLVAGFPGGRFLTVEPSTGAILADVVAEQPVAPLDIEAGP
ncbi:MAG TPA: ATP-binding protein, partial [Acidimicrobiia bacterium]|nr:ATP-binding protein [Acidimicrobiia bacterium]